MLRSLNSQWEQNGFHRGMADLAGVSAGEAVLDLGSGRGATIPHLLARVAPGGSVVALDRDAASIATVEQTMADAIAADRLRVVRHDAIDMLPFADESFDAVVCQNVLECVAEPVRVIDEACRVLRSDGRIVVGHHDFDGVIIASDDRALTRRLVHGFADHTQSWQERSDGQMGRQLPGLFAGRAFADIETETRLFVDLAPSPGSYADLYIKGLVELAPRFGIPAADVAGWHAEQQSRAKAGIFYFALPWVYVRAVK